MRHRLVFALLATVLVCAGALPARGARDQHPYVLYGPDGRKEVYEIQAKEMRDVARAAVALVPANTLRRQGTRYSFDAPSAGRAFGLCVSERFVEQPSAAYCSGALIGPDLVVTAGHCLPRKSDCERTAFVFDFEMKKGKYAFDSVSVEAVYSCAALVHTQTNPDGDFALVRLDRAVKDRKPMKMRSSGAPVPGTTLAHFGYPMGVPLKYASGAIVRESGGPYFLTSMDAYAGNSGSPIINPRTHRLEGILSRGEDDFDLRGVCLVSKKCPENGCVGEDVTDISRVRTKVSSL